MNKRGISITLIVVILLIISIGVFFYLNQNKSNAQQIENGDGAIIQFQNPKKTPHYESNTPAHGIILAGVPTNVVIDFNFDLHETSEISIEKEGVEYSFGETEIDDNKLSMRRKMKTDSPDGIYTVSYNACWPDQSCHDGSFQFAIQKDLSENYTDLTKQAEVEIKMSETLFEPMNIKISKGTKVIWINDDSLTHFVNTDAHPSHTYFLEQNSRGLEKGESYSLVFNEPGIYPYHCSAHANIMTGSILVE